MSRSTSTPAEPSDGSRQREAVAQHAPLLLPPAEMPSADTRHSMIAEAAYYRAEQRGFTPGHETEDWLAAEAEITRGSQQPGRSTARDTAH